MALTIMCRLAVMLLQERQQQQQQMYQAVCPLLLNREHNGHGGSGHTNNIEKYNISSTNNDGIISSYGNGSVMSAKAAADYTSAVCSYTLHTALTCCINSV
jgi:hypothetical protein